jgi:hypothetical protein
VSVTRCAVRDAVTTVGVSAGDDVAGVEADAAEDVAGDGAVAVASSAVAP